MAYLTPDVQPVSNACRFLIIPDDPQYLAIVRGALQELTFSYNWVQQGALTPEEAAAAFVPMFDSFCFDEECQSQDPEDILTDQICDIITDEIGIILAGG